MSDELWVVRAGRNARFVDEFLEQSAITIAFRELASDNLSVTDEDTIGSRAGSPRIFHPKFSHAHSGKQPEPQNDSVQAHGRRVGSSGADQDS